MLPEVTSTMIHRALARVEVIVLGKGMNVETSLLENLQDLRDGSLQINAMTKGGILRTYLPRDLEEVEKRNFHKRFQTA
jgi:uncharacterized protein